MKFSINGINIAYIDNDLLAKYRTVMNISEDIEDVIVIRDVFCKFIIEDDFKPQYIESYIEAAQSMAEFHGFKNTGEFIEYYMHREIEEHLDICRHCEMFSKKSNYCSSYDVYVSGNKMNCKLSKPLAKKEDYLDLLN